MSDQPSAFQPDGDRTEAPAPAASDRPAPHALPRALFTMTVDHVAAELAFHGFRRDARTIQRWCKSDRLLAILDHDQGDRYLIDPSSVRAVITTLRQEEALRAPLSRPIADPVPAPVGPRPDVAPTHQQASSSQAYAPQHDATDAPAPDATPRPGRDDVAMMTAKIAELEQEKAMLAVDKQVREQMVSYLKDEFTKMLDQAMTSMEELGQTRAENRFLQAQNSELRAALPAPAPVPTPAVPQPPMAPPRGGGEPFRFTPRGVMEREDFIPVETPVHRESDTSEWWGV